MRPLQLHSNLGCFQCTVRYVCLYSVISHRLPHEQGVTMGGKGRASCCCKCRSIEHNMIAAYVERRSPIKNTLERIIITQNNKIRTN